MTNTDWRERFRHLRLHTYLARAGGAWTSTTYGWMLHGVPGVKAEIASWMPIRADIAADWRSPLHSFAWCMQDQNTGRRDAGYDVRTAGEAFLAATSAVLRAREWHARLAAEALEVAL